jgi:hypothetical protein
MLLGSGNEEGQSMNHGWTLLLKIIVRSPSSGCGHGMLRYATGLSSLMQRMQKPSDQPTTPPTEVSFMKLTQSNPLKWLSILSLSPVWLNYRGVSRSVWMLVV